MRRFRFLIPPENLPEPAFRRMEKAGLSSACQTVKQPPAPLGSVLTSRHPRVADRQAEGREPHGIVCPREAVEKKLGIRHRNREAEIMGQGTRRSQAGIFAQLGKEDNPSSLPKLALSTERKRFFKHQHTFRTLPPAAQSGTASVTLDSDPAVRSAVRNDKSSGSASAVP